LALIAWRIAKWGVAERWIHEWLLSSALDERVGAWMMLVRMGYVRVDEVAEWDRDALRALGTIALLRAPSRPDGALAQRLRSVAEAASVERRRSLSVDPT
jgi:hypothetical protein